MDKMYMKLAMELAGSVNGQTSPNPPVGAVIVKEGRTIGVGAHLKAGTDHAEIHALRTAGDSSQGATVYVTLEPCSFFGKTPPCVNALINAKVSRVVIGEMDPNPQVSGNGMVPLREKGITVEMSTLNDEIRRFYPPFAKYIRYKRSYVIVKSAITLDGKIATNTGDSQWISSDASRHQVHELRNQCDAILVGIGTILADNPRLTTRLPSEGRNPCRIILDSQLRIPLDAHVIKDGMARTIVVTGFVVNEKKTLTA